MAGSWGEGHRVQLPLSPLAPPMRTTVQQRIQYTAGTAHLTNHDTRQARNNSRHVKEPCEMSLSASCLLRHTRRNVSFLLTRLIMVDSTRRFCHGCCANSKQAMDIYFKKRKKV